MSVTYNAPTFGPKVYMARGSSGWTESFPREVADRELSTVLGAVTVKIAIEGFQRQRKLAQRKSIDWSHIVEYLTYLTKLGASMITDGAGVAFWCQVLIADAELREGKMN